MNIFENNTIELFEMRDKVYSYLREEWCIRYYPSLEKIAYDLKIRNVRDKSLFYTVLAYLEEYKIILLYTDENGIERIVPHPNFELNEVISKLFVDTVE